MLRRVFTVSLVIAALASGSPARAETLVKPIMLPDYGSPSIGRTLHAATGQTGTIGYVFRLVAKNSFTLTIAGAPTGLESFDIFFYDEVNGLPGNPVGEAYNRCPGGALVCNKSGPIPAGAKWAVVSLVAGVNGTFRYVAS